MKLYTTTLLFVVLLQSSLVVLAANPKPLREPVSIAAHYRQNSHKINLKNQSHSSIERHIERYSQERMVKFLRDSLERAEPYLPYIMERIDYYGLPRELIYLPIVESGYKYNAVSRVGATGMWQFMYSSALPYGLVIDEWRDERLDVYLSTDAALRKLRDEMDLLGDPLLAIAAYNGGVTRLRRQQRNLQSRGNEVSFWRMYEDKLLPKETMEYVPHLLAVAKIMEKPRRYGLKPIKWRPQALNAGKSVRFIELDLQKQVNLELIAKDAGVDLGELKYLNRALRKGITPPVGRNTAFAIRLPVAHAGVLEQTIAASDWQPVLYTQYRVKKGDSFARIAARHSVSVSELIAANPRRNPKLIHPGEVINVPIK